MAQWPNVFAANLETHVVEKRTDFCKLFSDFRMVVVMHTHTYTHKKLINTIFKS